MANPYVQLVKTVWKNGIFCRRAIIIYYLAYIIAQLCLSVSPYALGRTIDVLQNFTEGRLHEVIFWLVASALMFPLFWLFHGPARVLERTVALKIQQTFLLDIYKKLTQLPLKWHQEHHSGNIITRLTRASASLRRFAEDQFIYVETIIRFLASTIFLCWVSLPVGLLSLLACMVALGTVIIFDRQLIPLYAAGNEIENRVGAGLFDYISNMTTVLTLRLAELTQRNLFQRLLSIWPFFKKEAVLNEVKWFAVGMLLSVVQSIILIGYVIYHLHVMNAILIGSVVMIFRYQSELSDVFYNVSAHYSELVRMNTDIEGVQPILVDILQLAHVLPVSAVMQNWRTMSIADLNFSHFNKDRPEYLLNHVHLNFTRGEKVALIGASGAGKSTLLNLLSGLYKADSVKLTIDHEHFSTLEPLHAITTLIPQEPEIFENTVAFNITMDLESELSTIQKVMDLAAFTPILETLPLGLSTDIREKGFNLSVGQKQRLALARGLFAARFSSFILMDEPTSSIDLLTEEKIFSAVLREYNDATMIVSLHRLHLLPHFDRIIMLDQGAVIADGPAAELLNKEGVVKEIWQKYQKSST